MKRAKSRTETDPPVRAVSREEILGWQRPAKLCGIVERCGYGKPDEVELNIWAKFIRLTFTSGFALLIRPREIELNGHSIKDEDLEDYLREQHHAPKGQLAGNNHDPEIKKE